MRSEIFYIIVVMAVVTFITRFGSLALLRYTGIPASFERWLKYIPVGILAALIMPALLVPEGRLDISWHNPYLLAGIAAALIAYKIRNTIVTMVCGMGIMFILRWIGF